MNFKHEIVFDGDGVVRLTAEFEPRVLARDPKHSFGLQDAMNLVGRDKIESVMKSSNINNNTELRGEWIFKLKSEPTFEEPRGDEAVESLKLALEEEYYVAESKKKSKKSKIE